MSLECYNNIILCTHVFNSTASKVSTKTNRRQKRIERRKSKQLVTEADEIISNRKVFHKTRHDDIPRVFIVEK